MAPILVANAIVLITLWQLRRITVYLDSDSGHYLADAEAIFGHGVRESRHLPGFPVLLGLLRFFLNDLLAVWVAMALLLLGLFAAFHVFLKGRVRSIGAELAGCFLFVCTPLVAEAVGWYGAAMLMGLGLSLVAMRLIDAAIAAPRPVTVVGAGLTVGAVGLTHPFSLVFLFQTTLLALAVLGVGALGRARAARTSSVLLVKRRMLAAAALVGIGALTIAPSLSFYRSLENPVSLRTDASQLRLVPLWAFREDPILWISLLVAGALLLSGSRWPGPRGAGRGEARLATWAASAGIVALANVVVSGGNGSYVTRNLYALPIVLGTAAALGIDRLREVRLPTGQPRRGLAILAVGVVAAAGVTRVALLYAERLHAALPYYNTMSDAEFDAVSWLEGRTGAVLVTSKFDDQNAGTLYSWMIEGLADKRAMGPGERYLYLIQAAVDESLDAARVIAGSQVREYATLRVGTTPGTGAPVHLDVLVARTWYPLLAIATPTGGTDAVQAAAALASAAAAAVVRPGVDGSRMAIDLELPPSVAEIVMRGGTLGTRQAVVTRRSDGQLSYRERVGDRAVTVAVQATSATALEARSMPRPRARWSDRAPSTQLEVRATQPDAAAAPWSVQLIIDGLDAAPASPPSEWTDSELIAKRSFDFVYTWTGSPQAESLAQRPCFRTALENSEVTILAVDHRCTLSSRARP